jgi:hypothetical protein
VALLGLSIFGVAALALVTSRSRARGGRAQGGNATRPPVAQWTEVDGEARGEAEQVARML